MWPFDYFKKKEELPHFDLEEILGPDPIKETTLMTEDFNDTKPMAAEQTLDQAVAKVQAEAQPVIGIIEGYANWTNDTVISLTESRNILAERIARDQEELRQINKVIEGMNLMMNTIVSEEPSVPANETSTKPTKPRKPSAVEMAS